MIDPFQAMNTQTAGYLVSLMLTLSASMLFLLLKGRKTGAAEKAAEGVQ